VEFRYMYIQVIFGIKYLVTILALVRKTVGKMNTLNMLHEVPLLIILLSTKSTSKLGAFKIGHFGDVVLKVNTCIIP